MPKTSKIERIYRPCDEWEEIHFNMWGEVNDVKIWLSKAIELTSNDFLYGCYMLRVIYEWPVSCENALTDVNSNRKAWIGHAAVALAIRCPEDIVRKAWGFLTDEQQKQANERAIEAVILWENNRLSQNVGN